MGDGVSSSTLLSSIRLKNVRQIPDHIPTINWQWILDNTHIDLLDYTSDGAHHECDIIRKPYFPYALVSDRINAGESSSSPAKPRKNRSASLSSTDGSELPIITYVFFFCCAFWPFEVDFSAQCEWESKYVNKALFGRYEGRCERFRRAAAVSSNTDWRTILQDPA